MIAPGHMKKPQPGGPSTKAATEPGPLLKPLPPNSRRRLHSCRSLAAQHFEGYDFHTMTLNEQPLLRLRVEMTHTQRAVLPCTGPQGVRRGASRTSLSPHIPGGGDDFGLHSPEGWRPMV